ncbi:uncharacterized protein LOC144337091 [Macaca mulatta]
MGVIVCPPLSSSRGEEAGRGRGPSTWCPRGGDRRGARGRARQSRALGPGSRFLALAGQEVGAFFRRPPPRRPSPLPARAPRPPGTSASFPFSPLARPSFPRCARVPAGTGPAPAAPGLSPALSIGPSAGRGLRGARISWLRSPPRRCWEASPAPRAPHTEPRPPRLSASVVLLVLRPSFCGYAPACVCVPFSVPLSFSIGVFPSLASTSPLSLHHFLPESSSLPSPGLSVTFLHLRLSLCHFPSCCCAWASSCPFSVAPSPLCCFFSFSLCLCPSFSPRPCLSAGFPESHPLFLHLLVPFTISGSQPLSSPFLRKSVSLCLSVVAPGSPCSPQVRTTDPPEYPFCKSTHREKAAV